MRNSLHDMPDGRRRSRVGPAQTPPAIATPQPRVIVEDLTAGAAHKSTLRNGLVAFIVGTCCTVVLCVEGGGNSFIQYAAVVMLIVTACVYRGRARFATEVFQQKRIAGAALDSRVKDDRLQGLRAQIELHFLFNTLATVRALVRADREAAIDMIEHLMRYLSEALPKLRQDECSLSEETQLIDAYLRIQQIRIGSRLSYELLIPDHLSAQRIPPMILLTLVENAVKHGINPVVAGGRISVTAKQEKDALVLRVSDSGQGMAATDGYGMGLANIRQRLLLLYGDDAVLSLSRPAACGVTASVSIPLASRPRSVRRLHRPYGAARAVVAIAGSRSRPLDDTGLALPRR